MEQKESKPSKEQVLRIIKKLRGDTKDLAADPNELSNTDGQMLDKLSRSQQRLISQDSTEETKK